MKKTLAMLLCILLIVSLTACGGSSNPSTTQDSGTTGDSGAPADSGSGTGPVETAADQIVFGRQDDVTELDPVMMEYTNDVWTSSLMLEGLVQTNDEGTGIVPLLASDWEISDDGLVYTFNLVPGVKFSDGSDVTTEDWIWSIERARDTAESAWASEAASIASVEAPDESSLVITLSETNPAILSNLAMFNLTVQSKAHYDATNSYGDSGSYPIGTGPYMVADWQFDVHLILEKNPSYRDAANVKTSQIKFSTIPDDNSRVMMLQSGELDIMYPVPFSSMNTIENTDGLTALSIPSTSSRYLVLNHTSNPALGNKTVREALMYGTNKQQIVDMVLYGFGEPAVSFMPKGGLYWNDQISPIPYDTDRAKELLAEAGYPDGFEVEFLVRAGNDVFEQIATIIKQQWNDIGVTVNLTTLETASLLEIQYAMEHEIVIGSWSNDNADPSTLADYFFNYDTSEGYFSGYNNPEASAILQQAMTEMDETVREDLFKQLQQIFYDDVVIINLYHSDLPVGISNDIEGFVQTPLGSYRFNNLAKAG